MCCRLHRFLGCLWIGLSCKSPPGGRQKPITLFALALRSKTIQLDAAATRFPISAEDIVLFQEAGQSYRGYLVLCASRQCIFTSLGLCIFVTDTNRELDNALLIITTLKASFDCCIKFLSSLKSGCIIMPLISSCIVLMVLSMTSQS